MASIPSTQTAAWIIDPGPNGRLDIRQNVEVKQPGDGEVLVKMEYSGICHSDCRNVEGLGKYTEVPGHEGVGTVVALGSKTDASLLHTRVGIQWVWSSCGSCAACQKGHINNCPNQLNTGRSVWGTLQQYVVARADYCTKIPDGLPSEVAAPLLCAGLSMAGAVSKLDGLEKGDFVVIPGAGGGLGHMGLQIAVAKGFKVIAVDSGAAKKELCTSLGATAFVDYMEVDVERIIKELTGGEGAHAVVVVPGTEKAYELAPSLIRNTGTLVCVGLPRDSFYVPISPIHVANRGLIIKGSSVGTDAQMDEVLAMALEGTLVPKIEVFDFAEAPAIIEKLQRYEVTGRMVVRAP